MEFLECECSKITGKVVIAIREITSHKMRRGQKEGRDFSGK